MAISTSYAWNPSRDEIIRSALRLVGEIPFGDEPTADQALGASDMLGGILKALRNSGVVLNTIERTTQTTTSGTASYTPAADTVDVNFPAYITPSSGSTTTQLVQMSRDEYMEISDKTTTGVPLRMYVEKGSTLTLTLWPVPDSTTTSFTYARERLLRDADSGTVTMDLPSRWVQYLEFELAHKLALHYNRSMERVGYLKKLALNERAEAQGADNEGGEVSFVPSWGGGWR